jgi:hypothetical protein
MRDECDLQFCNAKFTALVSSGLGQIVVKISGNNRFFAVDGRTPGVVIQPLSPVPDREYLDLGYTGYRGTLDGKLVWSPQAKARLLFIHRIDHVERLSVSATKTLSESFEQPISVPTKAPGQR